MLSRSSSGNRFLNLLRRMPGKILGDLANKHGRKFLVIVLAKLPKRPRGGDDDQVGDLTAEDLSIEQVRCAGRETVFLDLAAIRVG